MLYRIFFDIIVCEISLCFHNRQKWSDKLSDHFLFKKVCDIYCSGYTGAPSNKIFAFKAAMPSGCMP